ncbi:MAG: cytochrome c [Opitutaceae bacterium]
MEYFDMKRILTAAVIAIFGSALTAWAADAKTNWDDSCAKCHGADGKGETKIGKKLSIRDFTDATVQGQFTDDEAFKALKDGLKDKDGKTRMKAVEDMSDDDIKALVQYVRGLKK